MTNGLVAGTPAWYWQFCADADSVPYICGGDESLCTELLPALLGLGGVTDPSQYCGLLLGIKGLKNVWSKFSTYTSPSSGGLVPCSYPGKPRQPQLIDQTVQANCTLLAQLADAITQADNSGKPWGWVRFTSFGGCSGTPTFDDTLFDIQYASGLVDNQISALTCICSAPSAGGPPGDFQPFVDCCKGENANLQDRLDKILKKI